MNASGGVNVRTLNVHVGIREDITPLVGSVTLYDLSVKFCNVEERYLVLFNNHSIVVVDT